MNEDPYETVLEMTPSRSSFSSLVVGKANSACSMEGTGGMSCSCTGTTNTKAENVDGYANMIRNLILARMAEGLYQIYHHNVFQGESFVPGFAFLVLEAAGLKGHEIMRASLRLPNVHLREMLCRVMDGCEWPV